MKTLFKELWGLFVDDAALALGLLGWCAVAAFGFPIALPEPAADALVFFAGCLVILLANVIVSAARARGPSGAIADRTPDASTPFEFKPVRGGERSLP